MSLPEPQAPGDSPLLPGGGSSTLADGAWHRLHPLTPLFKGGIALIVIAGIIVGNLRERLIGWFIDGVTSGRGGSYGGGGGDPVDFVFDNHLVLIAILATLGVVVLLIVAFWLVWRFQQFRITGAHVEVRKGIVFRSHRRAPLDRVQGVNLTRPFPARIIGLAKLEIVGAGTDANVPLEYLSTRRAEAVRSDILRLSSGVRAAKQAARDGAAAGGQGRARAQLVGSINEGVSGLIEGVDLADVSPESVVKIPTGRLIGSSLISSALWFVILLIVAVAVIAALVPVAARNRDDGGWFILLGVGLGTGIPMVIAFIGATWGQISKSLRYSIAPTRDGVRITFGLLTTVTETIPPGRIFAVEVTQPLVWRPFGWWTVRINRMTGKSESRQASGNTQQFNVVLPVGSRADVERVLSLILPEAPDVDASLVWEHGILGPVASDPFRTMPRRAWWRRPLSWRRHGYAVTEFGLLLRRGRIWRKLAVFPLARVQGISLAQGPIDRAQRVAGGQVHTVAGPISGLVAGLDRADALALLQGVSHGAVAAAARDRTHRWADSASAPSTPAG